MIKKKLLVKIILPTIILAEKESSMVLFRTVDGMVGILHGHMNMVLDILPGVVTLSCDGNMDKYFLYDGVAKILSEKIEIVTDFAEDLNIVNEKLILERLATLEDQLKHSKELVYEREILSRKIEQNNALMRCIRENN